MRRQGVQVNKEWERSKVKESSHNQKYLVPGCWMDSKPVVGATYLFGQFAAVFYKALLSWSEGPDTCFDLEKHGHYSIQRDSILFPGSWEDHREWDFLLYRSRVGTRKWWVLSCLTKVPGSYNPWESQAGPGTVWSPFGEIHRSISKPGQTLSFINFHANLNDKKKFSSHFGLNFQQLHLKQEWQFPVHKNNISNNLITSSDLKKQVNGPR